MEVCVSPLDKAKRTEILILFLCLIIGFVLRFYAFDQKSLWGDEVYTLNDSRDDLNGQIKFYKENPTYLHPPLFFILTHQFYPFTKPERDLRIIPLISGILSIPMIYLLARQFSPSIALPCALSLTFMTYHISLSQDGRSYSLLMFIGMIGLYFFIKHLQTLKRRYLLLMAFVFSILFYTSYISIPFIVLSQILWLYQPGENNRKNTISSFLILNGIVLLLCLPWILILVANYEGQPLMEPFQKKNPISIVNILYGVFHDWMPLGPLMMASLITLILFPILSKCRRNTIVLLSVFLLPIGAVYLLCKLLYINHFVTSRYFINFLPLFCISIYLSLSEIEDKFQRLRGLKRLKHLFIILFIISNLILLPFYYRSEKQDYRGLANYLKGQIRDGDMIIAGTLAYFPGILHYFEVYPESRHYIYSTRKVSEKEVEFRSFLSDKNNNKFVISYSDTYWRQYASEGNRLWIVVGKNNAIEIKKHTPCVLKGYFDGSFSNVERFPVDSSLYLFLWDPSSPGEKGIDMPMN